MDTPAPAWASTRDYVVSRLGDLSPVELRAKLHTFKRMVRAGRVPCDDVDGFCRAMDDLIARSLRDD